MRTAWPGPPFRPATRSLFVLVLVRAPLRCVDLDRPWLGALGLREDEAQNPVLERGLDLGRIDRDRKAGRALELTDAPLLTEPTVLDHLGLILHLAADGDGVAGGVDLEVIGRDT